MKEQYIVVGRIDGKIVSWIADRFRNDTVFIKNVFGFEHTIFWIKEKDVISIIKEDRKPVNIKIVFG